MAQNIQYGGLPAYHFALDTMLAMPLIAAGQNAVIVLTETDNTTWASAKMRLLCVAQAIVCLVALPFKILFSIFHGVYMFFSENFEDHAISSLYGIASVGVCAAAIPVSIILSLMPSKLIEKVKDGLIVLRESQFFANMRQNAENITFVRDNEMFREAFIRASNNNV